MLFVLFIKISTIHSSNSIDYHVFSRIEQTVQLTALRHLFSSLVRLESWRGIVSKRFFSRQRERDIIVIFYGNSIDRSSDLSFSFRNKLIWTVSDDATDDRTLNVEFSIGFRPLWNFTVSTNTVSREIPLASIHKICITFLLTNFAQITDQFHQDFFSPSLSSNLCIHLPLYNLWTDRWSTSFIASFYRPLVNSVCARVIIAES